MSWSEFEIFLGTMGDKIFKKGRFGRFGASVKMPYFCKGEMKITDFVKTAWKDYESVGRVFESPRARQ